jgi:PAS domain S-box-containing protein
MPKQSFASKCADALLFRQFPRFAGAAAALLGLLIVASWYARWQSILQMAPNTAPMQYNTALCFILSGAGLFLLTTARAKIAPWLCGAAAFFALLTLLEYLTGLDFGIDQIFFKPYFQTATAYPGRMSPLAAICFIFFGAGIVLVCTKKQWPHRLAAAGMLACIVGVIAVVALCGFVFGIESATGWGAYSRLAINTSVAFLLLSIGLLIWSCQAARREDFNFLRWLPVTGSVTLMIMVAFVSAVNMADLKNATFWRKHTFEVILNAQAFEDNLIDLQRGARGYVTMGDTNALASYQSSLKLEPQQFDQLAKLTSDNPAQQRRLKILAAAMDGVFSYDSRVIALYNRQGFAAVSKTDANGESRAVFGNARDIVKAFSKEEQRLLDVRDALEQADSDNAARLLIFGSVLAALLLLLASYMAAYEMNRRRRMELKLQEITRLQKAILNSSNYAIISSHVNGIIRTFNPAAERMLGYSAAEVIGKATAMLWRDPQEVAAHAEKLSRQLGRPVKPDIHALLGRVLSDKAEEYEVTYIRKDGSRFPVLISFTTLADETGAVTGYLGVVADITERKKIEAEREKMIAELQTALAEVKTLSGLIPICAWCKNVRNDTGYWSTVEQYVHSHSDATFSHGMCPDCVKKFQADILKGNPAKSA